MLKYLPIIKDNPIFKDVSSDLIAGILLKSNILELKPKNTVYLEGSTDDNFYLLIKGTAKGYSTQLDKQVIDLFYTSGSILVNIDFLLTNQPSRQTVECISKCLFISFGKNVFADIQNSGKLLTSKLLEILLYYNDQYKSHASLLTKHPTAIQSYIEFQKLHGMNADQYPDKDIASYLGIFPESFNRIKKKHKVNNTHNIYPKTDIYQYNNM